MSFFDRVKNAAIAVGFIGGGAIGVQAGARQSEAINADRLSPRVGREVAELAFANQSSADILNSLQSIDADIQTIASSMDEDGRNVLESSYTQAIEVLGQERLVDGTLDHDLTLQQIDAVGQLYQLLLKVRTESSSTATSEAITATLLVLLSGLLALNSSVQGKRS